VSDPRDVTARIARDVLAIVESELPKLRALDEEQASAPRAPGKWSPKQIIGHLLDSAFNNHQRFVRAQLVEELRFPPYEQEGWVATQRYRDEPWQGIVELWQAYNRHLLHVMTAVPESRYGRRCLSGEGERPLSTITWSTTFVTSITTWGRYSSSVSGSPIHHEAPSCLGGD
jgi:hypothetical protein